MGKVNKKAVSVSLKRNKHYEKLLKNYPNLLGSITRPKVVLQGKSGNKEMSIDTAISLLKKKGILVDREEKIIHQLLDKHNRKSIGNKTFAKIDYLINYNSYGLIKYYDNKEDKRKFSNIKRKLWARR